jgi:histidinol phosphatase-like PHP family hydrolase
MKCALHVHTSLSDAALTPEEVVKIYADLEFGCVAITDHEFMLKDHYPGEVLSLRKTGLVVLVGVELDYRPWVLHHLLRIQGDKETLHVLAHPSLYYLEVNEVAERIKSEPFPIDAIEISTRGIYTPEYDTDLIPAPKVATDDAHQPQDCGKAWIEMENAKDPDRVVRAIKAGDFQARFYNSFHFKKRK